MCPCFLQDLCPYAGPPMSLLSLRTLGPVPALHLPRRPGSSTIIAPSSASLELVSIARVWGLRALCGLRLVGRVFPAATPLPSLGCVLHPSFLLPWPNPRTPALSIPPTVGCAPCAPHGTPWTVLLAQLNARCPQGVCRAPWVSRKRIVKRGDAGAFEMCPCYVTFQGLHLAQGMSPL